MKRPAIFIFIVLLGVSASLTSLRAADASGTRTWTSRSGQKIDATFEKTQYGLVYLKKADGKTVKIRTSNLSGKDQAWIRQTAISSARNMRIKKRRQEDEGPKAPQALYDLFGDELNNADEDDVSVDKLAGKKVIGIYFSAHWCPPCRAFTPKLVEVYNAIKTAGKPFEIVFVSSDRTEDAMQDYMEEMEMPWLAIPFDEDDQIESIKSKYGIRGIPTLVILDGKGETITHSGRTDVTRLGAAAFEEWQ